MTEYDLIIEAAEKINQKLDDKDKIEPILLLLISAVAGAGRQLTRLADQGDKILNPTTLEKLDRLNLFLQYALKEDAKKPSPAPDALVEAVKKEIGDYDMLSAAQVFKILDKVKADHEKAVE